MSFAFKYKNKSIVHRLKQVPNVKSERHGSDVTMKNKKEELSKWGCFKKDECTVLRGNVQSSVALMSSFRSPPYGPNTIESMDTNHSGKDFS